MYFLGAKRIKLKVFYEMPVLAGSSSQVFQQSLIPEIHEEKPDFETLYQSLTEGENKLDLNNFLAENQYLYQIAVRLLLQPEVLTCLRLFDKVEEISEVNNLPDDGKALINNFNDHSKLLITALAYYKFKICGYIVENNNLFKLGKIVTDHVEILKSVSGFHATGSVTQAAILKTTKDQAIVKLQDTLGITDTVEVLNDSSLEIDHEKDVTHKLDAISLHNFKVYFETEFFKLCTDEISHKALPAISTSLISTILLGVKFIYLKRINDKDFSDKTKLTHAVTQYIGERDSFFLLFADIAKGYFKTKGDGIGEPLKLKILQSFTCDTDQNDEFFIPRSLAKLKDATPVAPSDYTPTYLKWIEIILEVFTSVEVFGYFNSSNSAKTN